MLLPEKSVFLKLLIGLTEPVKYLFADMVHQAGGHRSLRRWNDSFSLQTAITIMLSVIGFVNVKKGN